MTHPFLRNGRADVLAHRGASSEVPPGNSRNAFARAVALGIDHIETDVQATADGEVVIFHDEHLDTATTASGRIADHRWADLQDVRLRHDGETTDDGLLLLREALEEWPETYWNIDIKTDETVFPATDLLLERADPTRVCVAGFQRKRLNAVRERLGPEWCSALAQSEIAIVRIASWLHAPVPQIGDVVQVPVEHKGVTIVDSRFVEACHDRDLAVHVWTVNDPGEMRRLRALGVDALITDDPRTAIEIESNYQKDQT